MGSETPEPNDSPLMKAWQAYKQTPEYANTRKWALDERHVDGSLWAAFSEGFRLASAPTPTPPADGAAERCKHGHTVCVACTGEHGGAWVGKQRDYAVDVVASEIGDAIAAHDSGETVNPEARAKHVVAALRARPLRDVDQVRSND